MKKYLRLLPVLALLFVAVPHAYAVISDSCYPAVQCDAGQDYYGTSCQKHITQVIGPIGDSCATSNPGGQTWNFNCTSGCYLSTNSTPPACPGGIMVAGNCLALLNVVNDSVPVTGETAYKIWDGTTLTEAVHVPTAGCANGETPVSDSTAPTGWKCGSGGIWQLNGTNAYYNGGRVGIGTNVPSAALDVEVVAGGGATIGSNTNTAGGNFAVSMGQGSVASGAASMALGYGNSAIADYSVALGYMNTALDNYAVAIGHSSQALASSSIAMGEGSKASTVGAVAIGGYNESSAWHASAMGFHTKAESLDSFVVGSFNYSIPAWSWNTYVATDPIFMIGIGTSEATRKNAMTVLKNGNVGIGTDTPSVKLDVEVSSGGAATLGSTSLSATGNNAVAFGNKAIASGNNSFALGDAAIGTVTASGSTSVALGWGNTASGQSSVALGSNTIASGFVSFAMGNSSEATANSAVAMGYGTLASGVSSLALNEETNATGSRSTALGRGTTAQARESVVIGAYNIISGSTTNWNWSDPIFVIGNGTDYSATSNALTVLKNGNMGISVANPQSRFQIADNVGAGGFNDFSDYQVLLYQAATPKDSYGIGVEGYTLAFNADRDFKFYSDNIARMTLTNGDLTVTGTATKPTGTAWINSSDIRLKDIHGDYEKGLEAIDKLNPVKFNYKLDNPEGLPSDGEHVGFIAQDVQPVFPEAITKDSQGYLQFDMHPVNVAVINAIKELKAENDELKAVVCEIKPEAKVCNQ